MGSSWQDLVIAGGQLILVASLLPMVWAPAHEKPPLLTSILNVAIVYVFSCTFFSLSLWFAMVASFAGASVWLVLLVQKYRSGKK